MASTAASRSGQTVALPIGAKGLGLGLHAVLGLQVADDVGEPHDADNGQLQVVLYLLYRRTGSLAPFLPVQGNQDAGGRGPGGADDFHRFPDGRAGGDDVVDDQNPAGERRTDDDAAFTVVLGLLAVEGIGKVQSVVRCEGRRGCRHQRDPLVGRPEQHVERNGCAGRRCRIAAPEFGQGAAGIEQPGVKKIRADAAGFQGEFAEAQDALFPCKFYQALLVIVHPLTPPAPAGDYHTRCQRPDADPSTAHYRADMRVITLNANGIRAAARKGFFDWLSRQEADVVCVQETKAQEHQLSDPVFRPEGFYSYYVDAEKKGYSGVAIYSRRKPTRVVTRMGLEEFDREGRYVEAQFPGFSVVSLYVPSGSSSEERQAAKFRFMDDFYPLLERLRRRRRDYIICGDWNIAHKEIDLKNWRGNRKNSGFLPEERAWMDDIFGRARYVDAFRAVNSDPDEYTWWSNRGRAWDKNVGWRIDYQVVTPALGSRIKRAAIYRDERFSDHAPLTIDYLLDSA